MKVYAAFTEGCGYDFGYGDDDWHDDLIGISDSKEVANSYVRDTAANFLKEQARRYGDIWKYKETTNESNLLTVVADGGDGGHMTFYATELTALKDVVEAELPTSEELNAIRSKEEEDYNRDMDAKIARQEVEE